MAAISPFAPGFSGVIALPFINVGVPFFLLN